MELSEIEKITKGFLVEEFEVEENLIQPEADMKISLDLDSLDYVDLVVIIEENFNFKVKPEDFTNLVTFNDFYKYIQTKIA